MHELSIAEEIISITKSYLPKDQYSTVKSVRVKIGRLSNILPDSLQFCFEALIAETPLSGARLEIENIPVTLKCKDCGHISEINKPAFNCSNCKSINIQVIAGTELNVSEIELND